MTFELLLIHCDQVTVWLRIQPLLGDKKQPYLIHTANGEPSGFFGLWKALQRPNWGLESFTIIFVPANLIVAEIHLKAQMPAILAPQQWAGWLEKRTDHYQQVLTSLPAEEMNAYPAST